jgi:antitoxin ParD1/3/4
MEIDKDCQSCKNSDMPTQNVNLTVAQAKFIRESVESGDYNNASEVVREALRLLKAQKDEHLARVEYLRGEFQEAREAYERGEYLELSSKEDFDAAHEEVCRRGRERLARERNAPQASA